MATFTVSNLNDSGAGSLRAAITAANAASPGSPNTIDFTVSGTIVLQSDPPAITNPTSIVAASTTPGSAPTAGIDFNHHAGLVFGTGSQVIGLAPGNATGNGVTLNAGSIDLADITFATATLGYSGDTGSGVLTVADGLPYSHDPRPGPVHPDQLQALR